MIEPVIRAAGRSLIEAGDRRVRGIRRHILLVVENVVSASGIARHVKVAAVISRFPCDRDDDLLPGGDCHSCDVEVFGIRIRRTARASAR